MYFKVVIESLQNVLKLNVYKNTVFKWNENKIYFLSTYS